MDERKTIKWALDDVSASSAGGAPFLISYGLTFLIAGILSFILDEKIIALIAMFQGTVALPLAFWLERRMGRKRMEPENPLKSFSGQLAVSQALAIPALIVIFNLNPRAIPVVLGGIAGMHFLPYAWLHRSQAYVFAAIAVALGTFGLQILIGSAAFNYNLILIAVVYWVAAVLVYRNTQKLLEY